MLLLYIHNSRKSLVNITGKVEKKIIIIIAMGSGLPTISVSVVCKNLAICNVLCSDILPEKLLHPLP